MSNRVYISPVNLRVSKPGYDAVTDTNPDHLLFDAFGWKSQGCFMKGIVNSSAFAYYTGSWMGSAYYIDINYGKTFSTAPKVHWGVIDPYTGGFMASYQGLTQYGTLVLGAGSFTNKMSFYMVTNGSLPMTNSFYLTYFIFQA